MLVLLCCVWSLPVAIANEPPIQILTHPQKWSVNLDQQDLRALFTLRQGHWPNGQRVRVLVLPDQHPLHVRFCREMLKTYPYVLRGIWDRIAFTGSGFVPETVDSVEEMRRRILSTPGAIGYLPADSNPGAQAGRQQARLIGGGSWSGVLHHE